MSDCRIKDVVSINGSVLPESTDPDYEFKYIDISSVDGDGRISEPDTLMRFGTSPSRARRVAVPGSTIVSTVRTYLRAVALVSKSETPLVFSTGFAVLEPGPRFDSRYLAYYCQSERFIGEVVARSTGVSYPAINPSEIGNLKMPIPDLEEQRRIADFLDAETEKTDAIITLRKSQGEKLATRRASVLDRLTQLPGGRRVRVKHLVTRLTSGPRGWGEMVSDVGTLFIRITNIPRTGIELDLRDALLVDVPVGPERERTRTRLGDVLVSITADIGSVGIIGPDAVDANVSQHVALLRPDQDACHPRWLAYAISAPRAKDHLRLSSYGGTKVGLGLAGVGDLAIDLPSADEQISTVKQIDREFETSSQLEMAIKRATTLLVERKQDLITAAVTGQIDVTTARGVEVP